MGKLVRAIGLMSGTSMDGIDAAVIETDGEGELRREAFISMAYAPAQRRSMAEALRQASTLKLRDERPGRLGDLEREITELHAAAVSALLSRSGTDGSGIDVIGFHGQTVLHRPRARLTVQLGDGQMLSDLTRLPVVYDMRADDVAAGGEGAPLAPVYHRALTKRLPDRPVAVVNIGGVSNVTWIGGEGELIAFDTGPGNALIDDLLLERTGAAFDRDGERGALGTVDEKALHYFLSHPYFAVLPPKSLDRQAFSAELLYGMNVDDAVATLAAFTAAAIAKGREHMPEEPKLWIVTGGGRRNRAIMAGLAERVHHAVVPAEAVGIDGDALEAEAWAYMAVRSLAGLPITFPGTTGAPRPMTGGKLARPSA